MVRAACDGLKCGVALGQTCWPDDRRGGVFIHAQDPRASKPAEIGRLQRGDIEALEPLVRKYHARPVRCAYLVVHDYALALAIAQA
jgi:hypothetical protein